MTEWQIPQTATGYMNEPTKEDESPVSHGIAYEPLNYHGALELNPEEEERLEITDEDAQSLLGLSISRVATHYTSPKTPAAEKAAVLEEWPDEGLVESDEDITPSATPDVKTGSAPHLEISTSQRSVSPERHASTLSLGTLPARNPEELTLPSPWRAGPKPLVIERTDASRSLLREALTGPTKRRSLSGSGDAIRKLLPSMPNVGHFIPTLPSTSFFSSNSTHKGRSRGASISNIPKSPAFSSPSPLSSHNNNARPNHSMKCPSIQSSSFVTTPASHPQAAVVATQTGESANQQDRADRRPRRAVSDESLIYHTTSRASSLGDDTRFEDHHQMVNSRMKAIRDSLQDRSSFRLPALPNMSRVPRLSGAMNFLSNGSTSPKVRTETDENDDILPRDGKTRPTALTNPAVVPGLVGATTAGPDTVTESTTQVADGNTSLLDRAIENLTGDVVIMGGYRGSILRSSKPPHRQVWVPVKVGLNLRKVNMEVGLNLEDEENMHEHIFPSGMIQHVGPIDISRRLFKRLRESPNAKNGTLRIWDYGYDWRLSPQLLSRNLISFLEGLPSNKPGRHRKESGALLMPHSLGGLITRHAVNMRPELFSGVIYAGVPQACVNILGPIRNGDAVLLSSRILTAQVNFTLRTTFLLLPLEGYCFLDKTTKEPYPVDFFDAEDWIKYRWSPCTDPPLPPKNPPNPSLTSILKTGSFTNLQLPGKKGLTHSMRSSSPASSTRAMPGHASNYQQQPESPGLSTRLADGIQEATGTDHTLAPQMGGLQNPVNRGHSTNSSVSTMVTIPRQDALVYLRRTLAEVKQFKLELAHNESLESTNRYPPLATIYGKSIPTVYGAKVDGRDGIACADCYDDLAFASGDGVCLAREAMLPKGYKCVQGGRISSDRGHVTLFGDLNAVGRAIEAVTKGRAKGLGLGLNPMF